MTQSQPPLRRSILFRQLARSVSPFYWYDKDEQFVAGPFDQLREAAITHLVAPAFGWKLLRSGPLPKRVESFASAACMLNKARNVRFAAALEAIGCALNRRGIAPIVVKGAASLVDGTYPDASLRFMSDLDLLVPAPATDIAAAELGRLGFRASGPAAVSSDHRHLPAVSHPGWGVSVELHREALPTELLDLLTAEEIAASSTLVAFGSSSLRLPCKTHHLMLAMAHGQIVDRGHQRRIPALRALTDIAAYGLRHCAALDWREIEQRFRSTKRVAVLEDTLALTQELFSMPSPLPLPMTASAAVRAMDARLDRSAVVRGRELGVALARSIPSLVRRSPREQIAALSPARWRERISRFVPPWA